MDKTCAAGGRYDIYGSIVRLFQTVDLVGLGPE
jgi:hypothetical protein